MGHFLYTQIIIKSFLFWGNYQKFYTKSNLYNLVKEIVEEIFLPDDGTQELSAMIL
jgi:hypothetical protein